MEKIFKTLLKYSRNGKKSLLFISDAFVISISCYVSFALRYVNSLIDSFDEVLIASFVIAPVVLLISLSLLGVYSFVLRTIGKYEVWRICLAVGFGVSVWGTGVTLLQLSTPRSVILIFGFVVLVGLLGSRFFIMTLLSRFEPIRGSVAKARNALKVVIYGAGVAGKQLLDVLSRGHEYIVVGIVDDDVSLHGVSINGVKVYPFHKLQSVVNLNSVQYVLIAMPSVGFSIRCDIIKSLKNMGVVVKTLPATSDIIKGRATVNQIREVDVVDLLGRDEMPPKIDLLQKNIKNKSVMVSGAGGSIGAELCRKILSQNPKMLVLFELCEYNLYTVHKNLRAVYPDIKIIPILGSVLDTKHVGDVIKSYSVKTLYHAAAHKHVPMVEYNQKAGICNNVFGTQSIVDASVDTGVKTFVLISMDKAGRPTNVMGASKRLAEMIVQTKAETSLEVDFSIVRFGNVLGSSGSVIPLFRQQINMGGPITITDKEITRYFMTAPEAASLVIQAGGLGYKGEVFVLDMGKSIKIVTLAERMIRLAGFEPYSDIEISYTGLRPGEKLYEELLAGEGCIKTVHPRIMTAEEKRVKYDDLQVILSDLKNAYTIVRSILIEAVDGYKPVGEMVDLLND